MKKLFAFVVLLVCFVFSYSQQIPKKYVLCEFATGTWCTYCPGAAMGAHDLVKNGNKVAIIKYHSSDPFSVSEGNTRMSYYSSYIEGVPTAIFNGTSYLVDGDHNNSLYNDYLPYYNSGISQMTSFYCNIDTIFSNNDIDFTVKVTVKKVNSYTGTNLKLFLALTESDINYSWQGQTKLHFLLRKMLPNGSGVSLDFTQSDSLTFEYNFSVNTSWSLKNCELVAFIQDYSSKEILQTDKKTNLDLTLTQNDVMLMSIDYPTNNLVVCNNVITPIITVKNKGSQNLTSFDVKININGELFNTLTINDNIAPLETKQIILDPIEFNLIAQNNISIVVDNPNGQEDIIIDNNSKTISFLESKYSTNKLFLKMNTGKWGFEISYSLFNNQNVMVDTSGVLSSYQIKLDTFDINLNECYLFKIWDRMSNGFNSTDGYCLLYDKLTDTLFYISGNFGKKSEFKFKPTQESPVSFEEVFDRINIFPNPTTEFINIQLPNTNKYTISLISSNGKTIYRFEVKNLNEVKLNISELSKGIYFLDIKDNKTYHSEKIIKL